MATNEYGFENNFASQRGSVIPRTNNEVSPVKKGGGITSGQKSGSTMGSTIPIITSLLGVLGTSADIDAKNEALMENMGNQAESLAYSQNVSAQQLDDLDRILGDMLSASGLETMKAESRLKAASAETGATGTSNQEAVNTAGVNQLHREASILRSYDIKKASKQSEMVAQRLGFENTLESMISGQQSTLSAGLETFGAGLQGLNLGSAMLSSTGREYAYGTNTTGKDK